MHGGELVQRRPGNGPRGERVGGHAAGDHRPQPARAQGESHARQHPDEREQHERDDRDRPADAERDCLDEGLLRAARLGNGGARACRRIEGATDTVADERHIAERLGGVSEPRLEVEAGLLEITSEGTKGADRRGDRSRRAHDDDHEHESDDVGDDLPCPGGRVVRVEAHAPIVSGAALRRPRRRDRGTARESASPRQPPGGRRYPSGAPARRRRRARHRETRAPRPRHRPRRQPARG